MSKIQREKNNYFVVHVPLAPLPHKLQNILTHEMVYICFFFTVKFCLSATLWRTELKKKLRRPNSGLDDEIIDDTIAHCSHKCYLEILSLVSR